MTTHLKKQLFAEPDASGWDWFAIVVGIAAFIYGLTTVFIISPSYPEFLAMGLTLVALGAAEVLPSRQIRVAAVLRALALFGFVLFALIVLLW